MTLTEVETSLRESHRPGETTHLHFDIDPLGQECFTVQRMTGARIHVASSLVEPGIALGVVNDEVSHADMRHETEAQLAKT